MSAVEPEHSPPAEVRHWCLFQGARRAYAVGLEVVAEVVEVDRLVRLPHGPSQVLGLCTLRREVVPVVRLGPDGPSRTPGPGAGLVLVLRTSRDTWAVPIGGEGTAVVEGPLETTCPNPDPATPWLSPLGTVRRGAVAHVALDAETTWARVRAAAEAHFADHWLEAVRT